MTETEWQNCFRPTRHARISSGQGERPQATVVCRCLFSRHLELIDDLGRAAVEAAENFADGLAGSDELRAARLACQGAGSQASWYTAATNPEIAARNAARSAQAGVASNPFLGTEAAELLAQASLVREIFGPQSHRQITVDPIWLTPTVVQLARTNYDNRAFDQLPSLADELEKVGCMSQDILAHCRRPGPHVRGCWVIDLVLGKE